MSEYQTPNQSTRNGDLLFRIGKTCKRVIDPATGMETVVKIDTELDSQRRKARFHASLPAMIAASESTVRLG